MSVDVFVDDVVRHVAAGGAEVASGPEVTTPVAFFQLRKLLLELAR